MKFSKMSYKRPDIKKAVRKIKKLLEEFNLEL